jgi:hypothetical protein
MPDPRWRRSQSRRIFIPNQATGIGLSELAGRRSVSDLIGTAARSWLRAAGRRIVASISARFANRRQQPAWPRAISEQRRNGPKAQRPTAGAARAATWSIMRRGAERQSASLARKSMAGAPVPPYHVRASPPRRPTGYACLCPLLKDTQSYRVVSRPTRRIASSAPACPTPVSLAIIRPSFEDGQEHAGDQPA